MAFYSNPKTGICRLFFQSGMDFEIVCGPTVSILLRTKALGWLFLTLKVRKFLDRTYIPNSV